MSTDCLHKIPLELKEPIPQINKHGEVKYTYTINIPCGKCNRCLERRKMEWGFRMEIQSQESKTKYFVTLTYNSENVPYNKYGIKELRPKHLQDFFKRLRQNQKRSKKTIEHKIHNLTKKDKISYYAAGEYGSLKQRPHFHAIIFNASRSNIEKSWTDGGVHIVPANKYTIAYTMKYLDKRLDKPQDWRKTPEFNTMSEGLGEAYIEKNRTFHKRNLDILFVRGINGIRIPMPKYYRDKLFTKDERIEQVIIVSNKLSEIREEEIDTLGQEVYNNIQLMKDKYGMLKFKKNQKNRKID